MTPTTSGDFDQTRALTKSSKARDFNLDLSLLGSSGSFRVTYASRLSLLRTHQR